MVINKRTAIYSLITIIGVGVIGSFFNSETVLAATCNGGITSVISCEGGGDSGIYHLLSIIVDFLTVGVGILAVIGLSVSGIQYIASSGNPERLSKAKRRIFEIVIGVVSFVALWSFSQWLLPSGILNPGVDNSGVSSISISYTDKAIVGKTIVPKVAFNEGAKDTTYSLVSSDNKIASALGANVRCNTAGAVNIEVVSANGLKSSTGITCEMPAGSGDSGDSSSSGSGQSSNEIETAGNTIDTNLKGEPKIRSETRQIINAHNKDFYYDNGKSYKSVVLGANSKYGSYNKYVKSLGGVFEKLADEKRIKVTTAADLQLASEYIFGLYMIWGPDYNAGSYHPIKKWKGNDAFYEGSSRGSRGYAGSGGINTILSKSNSQSIDTNCNKSINIFIQSTNLAWPKGGTSSGSYDSAHLKMSKYPHNNGKITKVSELRVGDIVNFFTSNGGHVAIVGEVYKDKLVFYDGGPYFQNGKYKYAVRRSNSNKLTDKYALYGSWFGWRPWKIDQDVTLKGIN